MVPFVVVVAIVTSVIALTIGRARLGLPLARLGRATATAVELVGATVLFFAANVLLGWTVILLLRKVTPFYFSLYQVSDLMLLVLSLLQALTFELWRRRRLE